LLSALKGEDRYDVLTLRGKKKKTFGTFNEAWTTSKSWVKNSLMINETLTLCKAYYDAKGEPFLPDSLPSNPQGYVRHILEDLGVIPMPEPRPLKINISRLMRMNPHTQKS